MNSTQLTDIVVEQNESDKNEPEQNSSQKTPKITLSPVSYSNLLKKLRDDASKEASSPCENKSEEKNEQSPNKLEQKDEQNQTTQTQNKSEEKLYQSQTKFETGQKKYFKNNYSIKESPLSPGLTPQEYQIELTKCFNEFFSQMCKYFGETCLIYPKSDAKTNDDKKVDVKPIRKTNLELIQNGQPVNIIKIIKQNDTENKFKYFDQLIYNKRIDFINKLTDYLLKYNIHITIKSKDVMMLHSPHVLV